MTTHSPRARGGTGLDALVASLDKRLEDEAEVLSGFLLAMLRGPVPPEAWEKLNAAARRDDRGAELAFAFEQVAQDRRIKTLSPPAVAEFLYRAATFFGDVFGDELGMVTYLEKALVAVPDHEPSMGRLQAALAASGNARRRAELYAAAAVHKARGEQAAWYRKAAALFGEAGAGDKASECWQAVVRLEPSDALARAEFASALEAAGRTRDLAKLLEQTLSADPAPDAATVKATRARLMRLYAESNELERALVHVEAALAADPSDPDALGLASHWLENKGAAGRAAAVLGAAHEASGNFGEVARMVAIELEHTRGAKRFAVLKRLGALRQDKLGDSAGALEALEAALALDASDEDVRRRYVKAVHALGRQADAVKTLQRLASGARDAGLRARLTVDVGEMMRASGDPKRARAVLASVLAMSGAGDASAVAAALGLVELHEAEGDLASVADMLERVVRLDTVEQRRWAACERLADLADGTLADPARAIVAWRGLVGSPLRPKALGNLERLCASVGDGAGLADVLLEQAKDETDPAAAQALMTRAADALRDTSGQAARACAVLGEIVDKYGPSREVLARYRPMLEAQGALSGPDQAPKDWARLEHVLRLEVDLAPPAERAAALAALGVHRVRRLHAPAAALKALGAALAIDPAEATARVLLEQLLGSDDGSIALGAASVLEPIYRSEDASGGMIRVLSLRAARAPTQEERLAALREALALARASPNEQSRALGLVAGGIADVLASAESVAPWVDELGKLLPQDAARRGDALFRLMSVSSKDPTNALVVARAAGDALVEAGDVERSLVAYRRAFELDPGSSEFVALIDGLLRRGGTPEERRALYRDALARERDPGVRRGLLASLVEVERRELSDPQGAIRTVRAALERDPQDRHASDVLAGLLEETGQGAEAAAVLEAQLAAEPQGAGAQALHAHLAELQAQTGDAVSAVGHCRALLGGASPAPGELDIALRVAERLGDLALVAEVLAGRARAADTGPDRINWLARLGEVQAEMRDAAAAARSFKSAALAADEVGDTSVARTMYERVRKLTPFDVDTTRRLVALAEAEQEVAALPSLYVELAECATTDDERYAALAKLAAVLASADDRPGALDAAVRAFAVRPASPDALDQLERAAHAVSPGPDQAPNTQGLDVLVKALDEAIRVLAGPEQGDAAALARLARARARALAADPAHGREAIDALRTLVADEAASPEERRAAAADLDALLSAGGADEDRRWLFEWRAEHAEGPELTEVLARWAQFEEGVGQGARALPIYERLAVHEPGHPGATAAAARLMAAAGDMDGALATLRASAQRADGTARRALRLQIAGILVEAGGGVDELEVLLGEAADAPALGLAARLLRSDEARDAIAAVIQRALDAATDPAARGTVLDALVRDAVGAPAPVRLGWHVELLALRAGAPAAQRVPMLHRGLCEAPEQAAWWDEAEQLARDLNDPAPLAEVFDAVLATGLTPEVADAVGNRAVAFHEEWFEDTNAVARILERLLEIDASSSWAFDRLKLLYDAAERWDDLFAAYDRVIEHATDTRKADLLEDAAQVAKDFANRPERAIAYLEQLLALKPGNARLLASLERLYERGEHFGPLIELLSRRLAGLDPAGGRALRARIASIWLDHLHDAGSALLVVEDMLTDESAQSGSAAEALLQQILAAAQATEEVRKTLPPPPADEGAAPGRPSTAPARSSVHPRGSVAPARPSSPPAGRGRGKRILVRQRAASLLKDRFVAAGRDGDLVKVLEVELDHVKNAKERIRRHREIVDLYIKLGDEPAALEHCVALVLLEPDVAGHREKLAELAERTGGFDRLAEVLATAADDCAEEGLRVELLVRAAEVQTSKLGNPSRAADLYGRVLSLDGGPEATLAAARALDRLLVEMGRSPERLPVLERIAQLEPEAAARRAAFSTIARLAADAGEVDRALGAWRAQLGLDPDDREALDGMVALLDGAGRPRDLVQALGRRAAVAERDGEEGRLQGRADRMRVARMLSKELGDGAAAIAAWTEIERDFGESDEGTFCLATLLAEAERWTDLADLLSRAAARTQAGERKAALLRRIGDIQREHLQAAPEATKSYAAALESDPGDEGSLAGLHELLAEPAVAASALAVLLDAYRRTDSWRPVLDLTDFRLRFATGDPERTLVLLEVAGLAEKRADDPGAAFGAFCKAFEAARGDPPVAAELVRLATVTGSWQAVADVHRAVIDAVETAATSDAAGGVLSGAAQAHLATLRMRLGEVLETRLDDPRGALAAYARVAADAPADEDAGTAAIRVAARASRWDVAAKLVVDHAATTSAAGEKLLTALENAASGPAAWDALTGAFAAAIAERGDLEAPIARDLEARLASWHVDRRGDPDAAEAAYGRALVRDPQSTDILRLLANLQRRAKGRPLIDSLLRLSQATGGDLDLLREAAEVAATVVVDRGLEKTVVERLFKLGVERWGGSQEGVSSGGVSPPSVYVEWALGELIRIHNEEGNADRIALVLIEASRLPFDAARARAMRHEAARVTVERVGDLEGALALYLELFEQEPTDREAASMLAKLYDKLGRNAQLLALRRRQTELATDTAERLALRVDAARLERGLGHPDEAIAELRANLGEVPRERETVQRLTEMLQELERHGDLVTLFAEQAALAENEGDAGLAADGWARAGELAERGLGKSELAVAHYRRVIRLEPRAAALDALARLLDAQGDHEGAAGMLDRLAAVTVQGRTLVLCRLADALVAAGRLDLARARLEQCVLAEPGATALSDRLRKLYRGEQAWQPLADLLGRVAEHAGTPALKLEALREAAELRCGPCGAPAEAIPLLEQACALAPDDRRLKLALADALGAAGRTGDARALLVRLLEGFGARRPKERAQVHFHLARLDLATSERAEALSELEAASHIDPANPEILRLIAELSRDDGLFDKAERAYRALLAVGRKGDEGDAACRSEVLVELAELARRQGQAERADEIFESAFEAAATSDAEASALERTLRANKQLDALVRAIKARCSRLGATPAAGAALAELAGVLERDLGRAEEAMGALLRAVRMTPAPDVHERARALAAQTRRTDEYAAVLTEAAAAAEAAGDASTAAAMWFRRALLAAGEPRDVGALAGFLEKARATGAASLESLRMLEAAYAELGDEAGRERALAALVELEAETTARDPRTAADAVYRLAELRARAGGIESAAHLLVTALDLEPDLDRAQRVVDLGSERDPAGAALLDVSERIARASKDPARLARVLLRKSDVVAEPLPVLEEAVRVAESAGDGALIEDALRHCHGKAHGRDDGLARRCLLRLAELVGARGDRVQAQRLALDAAEISPPAEARTMRLGVAALARGELASPELATAAYERMVAADPRDVEATLGLVDVKRQGGPPDALEAALARALDVVVGEQERIVLRLERARLLSGPLGRVEDAVADLKDLLENGPASEDVGSLLGELLGSLGRTAELEELLARQLDAAKDRSDAARVAALSLRFGSLLVERDRQQARDVFVAGLDWEPTHRALLVALLALLDQPQDAAERAAILGRLLAVTEGAAAEPIALELASSLGEQWDAEGAERALETGVRAYPASEALRARLLAAYGERGDNAKLANLHEVTACGPDEASRLRDAARLYTELARPADAARVLGRLCAAGDETALGALVDALVAGGDPAGAVRELDRAVEAAREPSRRAELLARRGPLRLALGEQQGALDDMAAACEIDPAAHGPAHAELLEKAVIVAPDDASRRTRLLRLSERLVAGGRPKEARVRLDTILAADENDRDALRAMAKLDISMEDWRAGAMTLRRLVTIEAPEHLADTALLLVDLSTRAGAPHFARAGLERASAAFPDDDRVQTALAALYERIGATAELMALELGRAQREPDPAQRFERLHRLGAVLLPSDVQRAATVLQAAYALRPGDVECGAQFAEALRLGDRQDEAVAVLQAIVASHHGRRSNKLAVVYYGLAQIERARGDRAAELAALATALEMDAQDGMVACDLAGAALAAGQLDLATKALRAVTMLKTPAGMSRALAYQHLGEIARAQGDTKRAAVFLKRAVDEDPALETARALLTELRSR